MALAAGIVAAGSLGGAFLTSQAAQSAAQTQANAEMQALALANQNLQPGLQRAYGFAGAVQPTLLGLLTPGTAASTLSQLPGYQWSLGQTEEAAQNFATKMGLGGNAAYQLAQDVSGMTANNFFFPYLNAEQNAWSAAMGAAGNFAGALTGAQTSALVGAANAQAAGTLGSANAIAGGIGGISNAGLIAALSGGLGSGGLTANVVGAA